MKMYVGFNSFHGQGESACLIFAESVKEAKKLAYPIVEHWHGGGWLELRVQELKGSEYLKSLATSDLSHVIECPEVCPKCEQWGNGEILNGSCPSCNDPDL